MIICSRISAPANFSWPDDEFDPEKQFEFCRCGAFWAKKKIMTRWLHHAASFAPKNHFAYLPVILPLLRIGTLQYPTRGDRMNPDITGYGPLCRRVSVTVKVRTYVSRVRAHSFRIYFVEHHLLAYLASFTLYQVSTSWFTREIHIHT